MSVNPLTREQVCVLHVIDSLAPGGAERMLADLVRSLAKRNISLAVCVTREAAMDLSSEIPAQVEIFSLKRKFRWDVPALLKFINYCLRRRVKIIHAHGRSSFQFSALAKMLALPHTRLIFHDHFGGMANDQRISHGFRLLMLGMADLYMGVSPELCQWAVKAAGLPEERVTLLENAIELDRFIGRQALLLQIGGGAQPKKAVVLANLRPQKDHPLLLTALSRSGRAREMMHVFLAGLDLDDAYSREVHQLAKELHIVDNVTFLGPVRDVPSLLSGMDYGLLSSKSESGPLVLLEYIYAGIPFLATETGQIASFLSRNGVGIFVQPGDVEAFAKGLDQLAGLGEAERREMVSTARTIVHKEFNLESRVDRLMDVYNFLIR